MKALVWDIDTMTGLAAIPDSAMTRCKDPFFLPDDRAWKALPLWGVRIDRLGKGIEQRYASRYYNESIVAAHPFASNPHDDHLTRWARDGAIIVSEPAPALNIDPRLKEKIDKTIAEVSRNSTLKTGDLILIPDNQRILDLQNKTADYIFEAHDGLPPLKLKVR